jgi:hypothetical protein
MPTHSTTRVFIQDLGVYLLEGASRLIEMGTYLRQYGIYGTLYLVLFSVCSWTSINLLSCSIILFNHTWWQGGMAQLQLRPPEPLDFMTPDEWPQWRNDFSNLEMWPDTEEAEQKQVNTLLYCMGRRCSRLYRYNHGREENIQDIYWKVSHISQGKEECHIQRSQLYSPEPTGGRVSRIVCNSVILASRALWIPSSSQRWQ